MEEILKILQEWIEYEKAHPKSKFEDFCRFYLKKPEVAVFKPSKRDVPSPTNIDG